IHKYFLFHITQYVSGWHSPITYLYRPIYYYSRLPMTRKYTNLLFVILISISYLALASCQGDTSPAPQKAGGSLLAVKAFVAKPTSFHQDFEASGTLLPNEFVILRPEISARITGIHFTEGSKVKRGQLLVQLYNE